MPNFTDHMKQIIVLASQSLRHAKAEKFKPAADDLMKIGYHTNEAMQQLDEMSLIAYQGRDPAKGIE